MFSAGPFKKCYITYNCNSALRYVTAKDYFINLEDTGIVFYFTTQLQQIQFHSVESEMCHKVKSDRLQHRMGLVAYSGIMLSGELNTVVRKLFHKLLLKNKIPGQV